MYVKYYLCATLEEHLAYQRQVPEGCDFFTCLAKESLKLAKVIRHMAG